MGKQELQSIKDWKAYRKQYQEAAEEIVRDLSLDEKISLMSGRLTREEIRNQILNRKKSHYNEKPYWAGGIARKNVMPVLFVDGPRGVVCERGKYTAFPAPILRGATFDVQLEYQIGEAIAMEVIDAGGNLFGGVCINVPYNPGWGRMQECYGEDTFHLGEMGAALVRGVQSKGVIACIKHFAFNSMENNRLKVNILCDKRAEREVFLPQFKKCVDAGAGAVMTAYNSYQGSMCGHNRYLIREVLKEEWDFDGFVMSDFTWGISDTKQAADAGMDMEMPHTYCYGEQLKNAVKQGAVKESQINDSAVRIVRTMLAHEDRILEVRKQRKGKKEIPAAEHAGLALQCAREGITLLQNRDRVLPLKCNGKGKKIAVIGSLAEEDNLGDKGSGCTYPPYVVNTVNGIRHELSGAELIVYSGESSAHCKRLAKEADAVILVVGNSYRTEGEHIKADERFPDSETFGGDRTKGLALPEAQQKMIDAVAEVRSDAILVLTGGGPILLTDATDKAGAIIMQYYPGMEGGRALAEILFGKVCPSGRLPFAIPAQDRDTAAVDWNAKEQRYGRYHGYTLLDQEGKKAAFEFGWGLSYTRFTYDSFSCRIEQEQVIVQMDIANVGEWNADTAVLLFVKTPGLAVEREKRLLCGFTRVSVKKGERKTARVICRLEDLKYYDDTKKKMVLENGRYRFEACGLYADLELSGD